MLITLGEGDKAPKCIPFVIMLRRVLITQRELYFDLYMQ